MKRKVFASVLSALMVTSSVSGVLMADVNEETIILDETEAIEETVAETEDVADEVEAVEEDADEADTETVEIEEITEEIREEVTEENEVIVEEAEEDVQDSEVSEETISEEDVFDEVEEPSLVEYDVPGVETQKIVYCGDHATAIITDTNKDGKYETAVIQGYGKMYDNLYKEFADIEYLTFEEGITSIGSYAFYGSNLKSVKFSSTITRIYSYAFYNCKSLKSVSIPGNITDIYSCVFCECSSLESVTLDEGVVNLGSDAFSNCTSLKKISFPSTLYTIGAYCFKDCDSLESVTIPGHLRAISESSFSSCDKLKTVTLGQGILGVDRKAFEDCISLESITIPGSAKMIEDWAFNGCSALKTVTLGEGVKSIGYSAFTGCDSLEKVTFPKTLSSIGNSCFKEDSKLNNVVIPSGMRTIGDEAFYKCTGLKNLTFSEGVTELGNKCFLDAGIEKLVLPKSVTTTGSNCFAGCNNLTYAELSPNMKSTGVDTFRACKSLKKVVIPEGVEEIGKYCFYASSIGEIYLPDSITLINEQSFCYCNSLTKVRFSKNLKTINNEAFEFCKSLESVTIPGNVETIGRGAFAYCLELKDITLGEGIKYIEAGAFMQNAVTKIVIPDSIEYLDTFAFLTCDQGVELVLRCDYHLVKFDNVTQITLKHSFDHSSDATCNRCKFVREIHLVTMDQFVERLYTTCLGRKSEAAGKEYWIKKLVNGTTGADAAHQFFFSSEFVNKKLSDKEYITRLYKTFMGRNPDTNGLNYWLAKIKGGYTREQVFQGFINSQEWADLCLEYGILSGGTKTATIEKEPSKGCVDFATRLYTTCLGRNPDSAGLKDWVTKLATLKTTGTQAAHGFFFSKEFTSKNYSNEEYIKRLYRTFMGREADSNGLKYWQDKFKSGYTREQVFQGFAKSAEFESICIQYGILK